MEERRISYARRFVRLLPALLIGAGSVYDYVTPTDFTGAPFFTAPLYSQHGTILTGVTAVLVLLALRILRGGLPRAEVITELVTVVVVSVLAVLINLLVRRSDERLASAREIAEAAQRAVLPEPTERIGGFQIAARYEAAQEGASIGGDLYAVQDSPHGVRIIVGDVRGKGMGAVGAVAVVIGAFREAAEQEATLEAVAQRLERALARERTRSEGIESSEEADFPSEATLLLHTDGLSEARDAEGQFYDPEAGLAGRANARRAPAELLGVLAADVRRHSGGGMADDMALIAVRRP
ncbi:PP2C family protein-serine/threonine phosphatase [Streptomyces shaanxiensis]|uniref:PP2C family protein-serine/threonine phosphatase n=1 Tax=Streptomyces shaanxiensis TaxID=653357 RepID=UPI0031E5AB77